jgi:heat shock protein HslJ/uncharacterized protein YecT (DUF1311 family)
MTLKSGNSAIALLIALAGCAGLAHATPLEDCATSSMPSVCLEARLKAANKQLNATLKAAQERLEQLQSQGRRPVLGAFIDAQRKFNAYRDAQCNWQGVRAPAGANSAAYVKDCQIRATEAREQELAAFVSADESPPATEAAVPDTSVQSAAPPDSAGAAIADSGASTDKAPGIDQTPPQASPDQLDTPVPTQESVNSAERGHAWRLIKWVANGTERTVVADSNVTIAFDPSGKVSGNATVNRYSGTYRFDVDGRLKWPSSGFTLTRTAAAPALLAQERAFLTALRRTSLYKTDGQQLILESANASVVLTFIR